MKTAICPICGNSFTATRPNAVYCSKTCQNKGYYERHGGRDVFSAAAPVTFYVLSRAKTKPANTSAVRWRMELRRRAMQRRFGRKNLDMLPDPAIL